MRRGEAPTAPAVRTPRARATGTTTFALTLAGAPDAALRALRSTLKTLLRSHGVTCVGVVEVTAPQLASHSGRVSQQPAAEAAVTDGNASTLPATDSARGRRSVSIDANEATGMSTPTEAP